MKGGNAEWFTPRRKRKLIADVAAIAFFCGGMFGGALATWLATSF